MKYNAYVNSLYDSQSNLYTITVNMSQADIQLVIDNAVNGATIVFEAGEYHFDSRLSVTRDNLTIRGTNDETGTTVFKFDSGLTDDAFVVKGKLDATSLQTLSDDAALGSKTITLADTSNLKAGDILHIFQANDAEFLSSGIYDPVINSVSMADNPLRESLTEIESIDGNIVTLKHALAYDMTGGEAKVEKIDALKNISISDLTLTYDLGAMDDFSFTNPFPQFENHSTFSVSYTDNIVLTGINVINAPSHSVAIRNSIDADVSYITVDGAYNKGGDGNGYGVYIAGTSYSNFEHLTITDVRHAVLFSSWNAEAWNTVQVDFTNRDINYHGSPDHSNTVIVNESIYSTDESQAWMLVSPGAAYMHPYTDISQNTNLFGHAEGSFKNDIVFGWDSGAVLYGNNGDDKLTGGAIGDLIGGGDGDDTLVGKGGADVFVYKSGDDKDIITDFEVGATGDILMVSGYNTIASLADVKMEQIGADTQITFVSSYIVTDTILLKNVDLTTLTADNFSFTTSDVPVALNLALSAGSDWITDKSSTQDVITAKISCLTIDDVISLGAGTDVLKMDSTIFTLDTAQYKNLSGVDVIDITAATNVRLVISQSFIDKTDANTLTLRYGAAGIEKLATAGLSASSTVALEGNGIVRLSDNIDNVVSVTAKTLGSVIGLRGNDTFNINGLGAVVLDGGAGNDKFVLNTTTLTSATTIMGGVGTDELVLTNTVKLSATAVSNISGIEKITFSTSGSDIQLTDKMNAGKVEVEAVGSALLSEKLRIGNLTQSTTFVVGSNVALTLSGTSSLVHTVIVKDSVNGSVKGSLSADILVGGTGNDSLKGLDGNDDISGGMGKDSLYGGTGRDTFRFVRGEAMDTIGDFETGASGDVVSLTSYYAFSNLADVVSAMTMKDATTVKLTLTPTEYILFKNQSIGNFTADNFVFDNSKILNLTLQSTAGVDKLVTGAGTDIAEINGATLGAGDIVNLGAGVDTLRLVGAVGSIDATVSSISNIEIINATSATSVSRLVVTDALAAGSSTGVLTIVAGAAGLNGLDTSAVLEIHSVVLQGNDTIVSLANGVNNKVTTDILVNNMTVNGGDGADSIRIRGGDVTVNSGDGNDIITVAGASTLHLNVGNGDDVFMMNTSSFINGQTIIGGAGVDELRFYQADNFSLADLQNVSGIEKITLGTGVNTLELDTTLFDSSLTLKSAGTLSEVYIDMTHLDAAHKLIIDSGIKVYLTGEVGDNYSIDTTSRANQVIQGSVGNENFTGGSAVDTFYGNDGDDTLSGGYGKDILFGDAGNDKLIGGRDIDVLTGGTGDDVFAYLDKIEGGDIITDFNSVIGENDTIDLTVLFDLNGFGDEDFATAISKGHLILQQSDANTLIIFDKNGFSTGVGTVLATLQNTDANELNSSNIIL